MAKVGEGERQTCQTVIIKYFYFLVEYLSFLIFFERMSWNARLLSEPSFAGKGGARNRLLPPHLRSPPTNHRWILVRITCISEATARLRKETRSPEAAALGPLLPSPSAFLSILLFSVFGLVSNFILTFLVGVFLPRPGCLLISTVNLLVGE